MASTFSRPAAATAGIRPRAGVFFRLVRTPRVVGPAVFLAVVAALSLLAPLIAPHDPLEMRPPRALQGPGPEFLLGTDEYGRDILSRLLYGGRVSLAVAVGSILVAGVVGVALGLAGGYYGGIWEALTMRTADLLLSIPPILLAIATVAFLGSNLANLILVIGLLYVPRFARVVHGSTLAVKQREFVEAARVVGARDLRILLTAILPNILAPIIVQASVSLGFAILLESGLSFLGLGAPPPTPSWGQMVGAGRGYMHLAPWPVLWPALMVWAVILAFNLLGDGLRDLLDPRLRG
jgi:peptide/nickel transport system permease protein